MKYIDADKLIAEIERRIKEHEKNINKHPRSTLLSETMLKGSLGAYESFKHFISTLQQEQTEIEKEAGISASVISNFEPCVFNLSVVLTQDEMEKMNIAPFLTKKVNIIIKDDE